ncbi:MAG: cation:proton antiporter [bacterium]
MADVAAVFLAVAGITLIGFIAGRIFERTGFPDIPLLLGIGLLAGPVNRLAVANGGGLPWLDHAIGQDTLRAVGPYMSGLGLVVILFESGLKLEFRGFRSSIGPALLHTLPIFLVTVAGIAAIGHWVLGMPSLVAVVLGVTLSNVGQTVSAALMRSMSLSAETKAIGFLEMALYDLISIPILVSLFSFSGGVGGEAVGASVRSFFQLASISLVIGAACGMAWILALRRLGNHPQAYMLTLAVLLGLYGVTQFLGGSGAIAVLLFGLMVGNRSALAKVFGTEPGSAAGSQRVEAFHDEISFFVRTVFFLYLGASFSLAVTGTWPVTTALPILSAFNNQGALFAIGAILVVAWFVAARWICISLISVRIRPATRGLIPVFGHGLGTAVLATLPFVAVQYQPGTHFYEQFNPWEQMFLNLALLIILATVLLSSILVWMQERPVRQRRAARAELASREDKPAAAATPSARPAPAASKPSAPAPPRRKA